MIQVFVQLRRYSPTKLCNGATFLHPVFPASRVQHISDLHSKFALRPHRVADIQSLTAENRLKEERKIETTGQKYNGQNRAAIIIVQLRTYSLVAKASCEFNSRPRRCRVTTLGKLFTPTCLSRSQWFSDGMIDCGVRGRGPMFIMTATAMYSLGHGLWTIPAVPRSTQPSTLRGMVK